MALVHNIIPKTITNRARKAHKEIRCKYFSFKDAADNQFIQLDTYSTSSNGRNVVQIMQFDETAATKLKTIIETTWPNLK